MARSPTDAADRLDELFDAGHGITVDFHDGRCFVRVDFTDGDVIEVSNAKLGNALRSFAAAEEVFANG